MGVDGVEIVSVKLVDNKLKEAMDRLGLTQEETARRTRVVTSRQLGRYLKNEHCPSLKNAKALELVLGQPMEKLFKLKVKTRKALPPLPSRSDERE